MLTRAELQRALEDPDRPEAQAVLNQISRFAGVIKGTRPFWYRRRRSAKYLRIASMSRLFRYA